MAARLPALLTAALLAGLLAAQSACAPAQALARAPGPIGDAAASAAAPASGETTLDPLSDPDGAGVQGRLLYWRDVPGEGLEHPRHVSIFLPPAYDADPTARFPVLYVHDGQNLFDPRLANTGVDWGIDEAMAALVAEGAIEPAIVVGVWSTPARRLDYAPAAVLARLSPDAAAAAAETFPQDRLASDAYVRFLADALKPRIDAAFRTRPDPDSTLLMGASMGGLISLYGALERPEVFGAAAGLSMHWPIAVSQDLIVERASLWRPAVIAAFEDYFASKPPLEGSHRFWIDHGTGFLDALYAPYQDALIPALLARGAIAGRTLEARVYPGADHNEAAWRARLEDPLRFLLQPRARAHARPGPAPDARAANAETPDGLVRGDAPTGAPDAPPSLTPRAERPLYEN